MRLPSQSAKIGGSTQALSVACRAGLDLGMWTLYVKHCLERSKVHSYQDMPTHATKKVCKGAHKAIMENFIMEVMTSNIKSVWLKQNRGLIMTMDLLMLASAHAM